MSGPYDEIIELPHHVSVRHPHMSVADRAAQFAPFAALTGYDSAVKETARQTEDKVELSEERKAELDMKQSILMDAIADHPEVFFTYFVPDELKAGGRYITKTGTIKRLDTLNRVYIMDDGTQIPLDEVSDIDSVLFQGMF